MNKNETTTEEAPRFFWITPKWPLPAEDGARRATVHLLKSLSQLGADIHLCSIVPDGEEPVIEQAIHDLGVRSVSIVHRKPSTPLNHIRNLIMHPLLPLTVTPYASREVASQVSRAFEAQKNRTVVFDGLHTAGWLIHFPADKRAALHKIYRAHNVESNLWSLGAERSRNPLKAHFLSFQAARMRSFESEISRESMLVAAVSRNDEAAMQKLYGPIRTICVPIGIPLVGAASSEFPTERRLLFIGRLDWQPNKEGLAWFLENVWPVAARESSDLRLTIIGAGEGGWLEVFRGLPRVRIIGRVPDVAPYYQEAAAALAPVFFGSGTRVKAIEASSFARPCISTAIGVEGIGLDPATSYFRAETREDWIEALRAFDVVEAKKRGQRAFELIADEFEPARVAQRFLRTIADPEQRENRHL